jgi:hypothetical protein
VSKRAFSLPKSFLGLKGGAIICGFVMFTLRFCAECNQVRVNDGVALFESMVIFFFENGGLGILLV